MLPVFQKEFSDMYGAKQAQMKFIIVKLALKKLFFAPLAVFRWSSLSSKIAVKKRSVTTFDWEMLAWKTAALFDTSFDYKNRED